MSVNREAVASVNSEIKRKRKRRDTKNFQSCTYKSVMPQVHQ